MAVRDPLDTLFFILIVLNFILSFSYRSQVLSRADMVWLRSALFFTMCADFCMLILYRNTPGLLFFIAVQWIYFGRYTDAGKAARLAFPVSAFAIVLFFIPGMPAETKLACVYAFCLCASVMASIKAFVQKKKPLANRLLIFAGMLLFFLCDINVMLYNLLPDSTGRLVCRVLIWVFYLPSQLCLCLSGRRI